MPLSTYSSVKWSALNRCEFGWGFIIWIIWHFLGYLHILPPPSLAEIAFSSFLFALRTKQGLPWASCVGSGRPSSDTTAQESMRSPVPLVGGFGFCFADETISLRSSTPLGACCCSHEWYVKNFRANFDFWRTGGVSLRWSVPLTPAGKETQFFFVRNGDRLAPEPVCRSPDLCFGVRCTRLLWTLPRCETTPGRCLQPSHLFN